LYITGISDQAALIIQQARQRGYKGEILGGCSDLNDAKILQKSNNAAVNAITFSAFNEFDQRPIVQSFVAKYKAKYNADPSNFVSAGYDSVYLFADAAKRANTTTDRQAFRDALGQTSGLEGVNGKYTYSNSGDNQTPGFTIFRIKDGGGYVAF
jgi:branched-chain amino acid transport system substrate-binding protein